MWEDLNPGMSHEKDDMHHDYYMNIHIQRQKHGCYVLWFNLETWCHVQPATHTAIEYYSQRVELKRWCMSCKYTLAESQGLRLTMLPWESTMNRPPLEGDGQDIHERLYATRLSCTCVCGWDAQAKEICTPWTCVSWSTLVRFDVHLAQAHHRDPHPGWIR